MATPDKGGNITEYNKIVGSEKTASCEEYTMCKFESNKADEFVALELILDWGRKGDAGKKSPVLSKDVAKVGISNKGHKKAVNLIQLLYVKQVVNTME